MKVLVSGVGGFIGSYLCEALIEKGYGIKTFVRYNSRNFWGWIENSPYKLRMEVVTGDIRDCDNIKNAMKDVERILL